MPESTPLKDNVPNLQKGHNEKHPIRWSLMKLHRQHLMASAFQPDLSGLNEKLQNLLSGHRLCSFTQRPNKTPYYAYCFKEADNKFKERSNRKVCMQIFFFFFKVHISKHNEKCIKYMVLVLKYNVKFMP